MVECPVIAVASGNIIIPATPGDEVAKREATDVYGLVRRRLRSTTLPTTVSRA
jgi:hypothetical protein